MMVKLIVEELSVETNTKYQCKKILSRIKSNFIRIETNIIGNFCAILRKIRHIVFELKFLKDLIFEEELKLHAEKLKINLTLNTKFSADSSQRTLKSM